MCLQWFLFCALLMLFAGSVSTQPKWTHGQRALLLEPPQRSSLWRFGNETPLNINDSALNCGGFEVKKQIKTNYINEHFNHANTIHKNCVSKKTLKDIGENSLNFIL